MCRRNARKKKKYENQSFFLIYKAASKIFTTLQSSSSRAIPAYISKSSLMYIVMDNATVFMKKYRILCSEKRNVT